MFSDDAYNKNVVQDAGPEGQGTLIGNWFEEHALREATGEGRSVPQRHLPRSGLLEDFTKTPSVPLKKDNTFERVYGPASKHRAEPWSRSIGQQDKHAGKIIHVGPREWAMITGRHEFAEKEVQDEEEVLAQMANARSFATTTGTVHCKPDELQVEKAAHARKSFHKELMHGPSPERTLQLNTDALDVLMHAHYSNHETVTHSRVSLADPRMRNDLKVTACGGVNAFGKNSEFTKSVSECVLGPAKDEALVEMYHGLKKTNPLRHIGGHQPRGPFQDVPSLASLKTCVHAKISEVWGAYGYVALRQKLFDVGDHEGFVRKSDVISIFRDQLALSTQEVPAKELDIYLSQLVTMKKTELRISALMSSLRPILTSKEKRRVLEAFKAMSPTSGEVRLGDWLSRFEDQELRTTIVEAFGAQDEVQVASTMLTEQVFMELVTDLAPFTDINKLMI